MPAPPPHTLNYVQPLFLEQQRARDVFPKATALVAVVAFGLMTGNAVISFFTSRTFWLAFIPGAMIAMVFVAIAALFMRYSTGTTIVETTMVQLRMTMFGFQVWSRTIPIQSIKRVDLHNMTGQLSVLKHGIGELMFMTRKTCVRLHLPEFSYVMIGSATPEELRDAIDAARLRATEATEARADSVAETNRAG